MYRIKKLLSIVCVIATLLSATCVVANAEEGVGDTLGINNDNSNFSELVCIEDGKAYLPIRLIFPNLNDREKKMGLSIRWGATETDSTVRLTHGTTTGDKLVDGATPFEGVRSCVDIIWMDDASVGATAYLTVIKYTYDADGEMEILDYDDSNTLTDKVYTKKVEGGDRVFVSIEDMNKIVELIDINGEYSVKLYK